MWECSTAACCSASSHVADEKTACIFTMICLLHFSFFFSPPCQWALSGFISLFCLRCFCCYMSEHLSFAFDSSLTQWCIAHSIGSFETRLLRLLSWGKMGPKREEKRWFVSVIMFHMNKQLWAHERVKQDIKELDRNNWVAFLKTSKQQTKRERNKNKK